VVERVAGTGLARRAELLQQPPKVRAGDSWKTKLHAPGTTSYVTLRTTAHDDQGNSVTQSITRAFGLK
jgi:hypothetical protein